MKTFLHIMALIPIPVFSLPVWFFTINKKPKLAFISAKVMNFQLSLLVYLFTSTLLLPLFIGFVLIVFVATYYIVFILKNMVKASSGNIVYPYSISFF
ncbi:MAG: DUF4870 domain-containing protein [Ignavibacteriaceae bacterium]|nr:DUF4870 domain-containing protein [Ignavibacteriaceae bacterium]